MCLSPFSAASATIHDVAAYRSLSLLTCTLRRLQRSIVVVSDGPVSSEDMGGGVDGELSACLAFLRSARFASARAKALSIGPEGGIEGEWVRVNRCRRGEGRTLTSATDTVQDIACNTLYCSWYRQGRTRLLRYGQRRPPLTAPNWSRAWHIEQ